MVRRIVPKRLGRHLGVVQPACLLVTSCIVAVKKQMAQLDRRIGADHRADVAPVQDGTGFLRGEAVLEIDQGRAHLRDCGNAAGGLPGLLEPAPERLGVT